MSAKSMMAVAAAAMLGGAAWATTPEEVADALDVNLGKHVFSAGDATQWSVDTNTFYSGSSSMRTPSIGHSQTSEAMTLQLVLDEPSIVSLWYKVSSESGYDVLIGNREGEQFLSISGEAGWSQLTRVIDTVGTNVFTFTYRKDGSGVGGSDCGWIDGLTIVPLFQRTDAVRITNISCAQRTPWNGKVDIDYTVSCANPDADIWVYPVGYDRDTDTTMAPRALEGDGVNAPVKAGTHRMTWTVTDDYPRFNSTAFTVKMTALTGGAPYMVVDLSGGVDAQSYPVTYLSSVPEGGWGEEYMTTKLVLRLVPSGLFKMGSPSDEVGRGSYEDLHGVALTKPFYIGVFECTQKQYELVMGNTPSYYRGDKRPVERVTYDNIRGTVSGAGWPTHNQVDADSFMGRLRSKANMLFDLPTEAQWEYACRAGTATGLNSGKECQEETANLVARFSGNRNDGKGGYSQHTVVGSYLENAWGLYDMHGNVSELCRDAWLGNLGTITSVDPVGGTGSSRVYRGGSWNSGRNYLRSAYRNSTYISRGSSSEVVGFRVSCSPVAQ